jgi:hypothetical protein
MEKTKKFTNNLEYYHSRKSEMIKCKYCDKNVHYFGVSRHRQTVAHKRSKEIYELKSQQKQNEIEILAKMWRNCLEIEVRDREGRLLNDKLDDFAPENFKDE